MATPCTSDRLSEDVCNILFSWRDHWFEVLLRQAHSDCFAVFLRQAHFAFEGELFKSLKYFATSERPGHSCGSGQQTDFSSNRFFTKGTTLPHYLHAAVLLAIFIAVPFCSFHFMWFKSNETCSYNFLYQNGANEKAFNLPCIKVQATEWGNELFLNPILLCHYSHGIAVGCIDHSWLHGCVLTTKCNLEGIQILNDFPE